MRTDVRRLKSLLALTLIDAIGQTPVCNELFWSMQNFLFLFSFKVCAKKLRQCMCDLKYSNFFSN